MMRLSIWPEFSSNHSSRFTVVGVFETPDLAQQAADQLNRDLESIWAWYQNPDNTSFFDSHKELQASPPEQQIAAKYDVEWPHTFLYDWMIVYPDGSHRDPVGLFENLVFVDGTQSHMAAHPVEVILEKLGARALVDGTLTRTPEIDCEVTVTISCQASDETTAQAVYEPVHEYFHWRKAPDALTDLSAPWDDPQDWWSSYVDGSIEREGTRLVLILTFFHIAEELPQVIDYLRSHGCTGLRYHFSEFRYY